MRLVREVGMQFKRESRQHADKDRRFHFDRSFIASMRDCGRADQIKFSRLRQIVTFDQKEIFAVMGESNASGAINQSRDNEQFEPAHELESSRRLKTAN